MVTANDYVGRRVDLLVLHSPGNPGTMERLVGQFADNDGGKIVAGLQKLVQRIYIELLQEIGSELYFPDRGCGYLTELRAGGVRTPADLLSAFARGVLQITTALRTEETDDMPDDERLGAIETLNVLLDGDRASVTFRVTALSGESAVYIAPASFTL